MKQYKLYIFDFDGTLVDSHLSMIDIFNYSFGKIGEECTPEQAIHYMRGSLQACIKERQIDKDPNKCQIFVKAIMDSLEFKEINDKTFAYDDTLKTIRNLEQNGAKFAIVTGNNVDHVKEILKHIGLLDAFDAYVGSDTCKVPKPYAEPLNMVFDLIPGFLKEEACYIGDSMNDYLCAVNAGVDGYLLDRNDEYLDFKGPKIKSLNDLIINL